MERLGLVGLPNAGKSSLFNALTGGNAPVAAHPFSTTETNVGVAQVPDERLEALAEMSKSRKVVRATQEFVDIAGLVAGAASGEGLGNRFLAGIREVDAICLVLRAFEDENVAGDHDPLADLQVLELELVLADLATVESQIDKRRKAAKADKSLAEGVAALAAALERAARRHPDLPLVARRRPAGRPAALLPAHQQAGPGRGQHGRGPGGRRRGAVLKPVADELAGAGDVLAVSVKLEAEMAQLDPAERAEMLEGLGLGEGALPRVARAAYHLLGRRTFLTTGDKESRAWTFRAGARAPECAGVIHSDLQRGFIRAEVIRWDELLELGSWSAAKDVGRMRVEGKDYEVQDGDVLEIRFNV